MVPVRDFIVKSILAQSDRIAWKQINNCTDLLYRQKIRVKLLFRLISSIQYGIVKLNQY